MALERFDEWINVLNKARGKSAEQVQALKEVDLDKDVIRDATRKAANYPEHAWNELSKVNYVDRRDRAGRPIPHACLKIPTGGGKTLMAAAVLERLGMRTGLVLWVVPTTQIYEQTLGALRERDSPIRQRLDACSSGCTKILEKDDRFSKRDTEQYLCVMLLMLAATNRSRDSGFLLINRDSGKYLSFFPDEDDVQSNAGLLEHPGLETEDGRIKRSLANVIRMMQPVVILDEAHKAYRNKGLEYSGMVNHLNPRLVVEMSATPNEGISNLLVNVSGVDMWKEEMIKMPIDLNIQTDSDWKHMLSVVRSKLDGLGDDARLLQSDTGRYVRPIAVVRVERTGKNQRGGDHIHADDVKDYLINGLCVPEDHIAVQSSERKEDLDGVDLMSESTPIRWIITKDALKEGWDCPFAYVLVILDNVATHTSVTQLLGRVLRQPEARLTCMDSLDQCYVYCHRSGTGDVAEHVKKGLSEMGMDKMDSMVRSANQNRTVRTVTKHQKEQHGSIFLPLVLHRNGREWKRLEYENHILSGVDFDRVGAPDPANFSYSPQGWVRRVISLEGGPETEQELREHDSKSAKLVDFALRLSDVVPNVWQAARISQEFLEKLRNSGKTESDIYNNLPYLVKVLHVYVDWQVNRQAEDVFRDKLERGNIRFDLEIDDRNYQIRDYDVEQGTLLQREGGGSVQHTLFDTVYEEEFDTEMERNFARYLDGKGIVRWWHRVAARQGGGYHLVGWERRRYYPDFIVMTNEAGDRARLGIYDTKGENLVGNRDTAYKERLLETLESAFDCGMARVRDGRMRGEFRLVLDGRFNEILAGDGEETAGAS